MKKSYSRGFTLIELLVVIAIIGILASVVLVSLGSARNKAKDARVAAVVQQLRTQVEADYVSNYNTSFSAADTFVTTGNYATLINDATNNIAANTVSVKTNASTPFTAYAIYGKLVTDTAKYFCIDSTGKTNQSAGAASTVTCP